MEKAFVVMNRIECRRWNDSLAIIKISYLFCFCCKKKNWCSHILMFYLFFSCIIRIWLDRIGFKCINKILEGHLTLVLRSFLFVNSTDKRFNWRRRKTTWLCNNWGGGASYVCDNHFLCQVKYSDIRSKKKVQEINRLLNKLRFRLTRENS